MRKLSLLLTVIVFTLNIQAQNQTYELVYHGPKKTEELITILNTNQSAAITQLSQDQKNSLIAHMVFDGIMFMGMDVADENILKLYATNWADVLSEICQTKAHVSATHTPRCYDVKIITGPGLLGELSYCTNCYLNLNGGPELCCTVGGGGCEDERLPAAIDVFCTQ